MYLVTFCSVFVHCYNSIPNSYSSWCYCGVHMINEFFSNILYNAFARDFNNCSRKQISEKLLKCVTLQLSYMFSCRYCLLHIVK